VRLDEIWDGQAHEWTRFARDPLGDRTNLSFNLPRFLELVPAPGGRTLDLGCGEGRCGAALRRQGHVVIGTDASPAMVAAASESIEAIVSDGAALPFEAGAFDLVVAFMSLQDMDDLHGVVREAARVLERGGRFCFSVVHPINGAGTFEDGVFTIRGSYLEVRRIDALFEGRGYRINFAQLHRPLEDYARALAAAGFRIEALREPRHPDSEKWSRLPLFLHVRAVKR